MRTLETVWERTEASSRPGLWFNVLEAKVRDWSVYLWQEEPLHRWEAQVARLTASLHRSRSVLVDIRRSIEVLKLRLDRNEKRATFFAKRVKSRTALHDRSGAYHDTLDLEEIRLALARDLGLLHKKEATYQNHLVRVERIQRRLRITREKLLESRRWV